MYKLVEMQFNNSHYIIFQRRKNSDSKWTRCFSDSKAGVGWRGVLWGGGVSYEDRIGQVICDPTYVVDQLPNKAEAVGKVSLLFPLEFCNRDM